MNSKARTIATGMRSEAQHGEAREDGAVDERPRSVYEIVTRRMLEEMREDVSEVKGRVNALIWLVAGATLVDLLLRIAG
jgi:hypothetical protein